MSSTPGLFGDGASGEASENTPNLPLVAIDNFQMIVLVKRDEIELSLLFLTRVSKHLALV